MAAISVSGMPQISEPTGGNGHPVEQQPCQRPTTHPRKLAGHRRALSDIYVATHNSLAERRGWRPAPSAALTARKPARHAVAGERQDPEWRSTYPERNIVPADRAVGRSSGATRKRCSNAVAIGFGDDERDLPWVYEQPGLKDLLPTLTTVLSLGALPDFGDIGINELMMVHGEADHHHAPADPAGRQGQLDRPGA